MQLCIRIYYGFFCPCNLMHWIELFVSMNSILKYYVTGEYLRVLGSGSNCELETKCR